MTGCALAAAAIAAVLWLPSGLLAGLLTVVMALAAWEWAGLTRPRGLRARIIFLTVMALATALAAAALAGGYALVPITVGALWWAMALVILAAYQPGRKRLAGVGLRVAGVLTLVPAWAALIELHVLDPELLLFVFALVWLADSAAYFVGRWRGRSPLAPEISPGKTREGLWGALLAGLATAGLGAWWLELPALGGVYFVGLSLLTVLVSVAGDLFESLLKREAGAKDSGGLLPGHGGFLDRIDSIAAAAPVFALGWHWLD